MKEYIQEQIESIVSSYNYNRDTGASKARANNKTLIGRPEDNRGHARFMYSLASKGYTAEQIEEHVIKACTSQSYHNIYDLLTEKSLKADGVTPTGNVTPIMPAATTEPDPAATTEPEPAATPADGLTAVIVGACGDEIRRAVHEEVKAAAAAGAIETPLTIITPSGKTTTAGKHEVFKDVLEAVANNIPLYLWGPAGSGKNVICHQVADALNLDFYYSNSVTQEYKLSGYMDAYGNFSETQFYKAFKYGGLFMLDEMDASAPEVLTLLNGALSDGMHVFGNNEVVTMHENFRAIAAGNTFGRGATLEYTGRMRLDESTLNRFEPREVDYSRKIEDALAPAECVEFCRAFRKACKKAGIPHVISYRNITNLNKLSQIWPIKEAVKSAAVGSLSADDLSMIYNDLPAGNKYTDALAACL